MANLGFFAAGIMRRANRFAALDRTCAFKALLMRAALSSSSSSSDSESIPEFPAASGSSLSVSEREYMEECVLVWVKPNRAYSGVEPPWLDARLGALGDRTKGLLRLGTLVAEEEEDISECERRRPMVLPGDCWVSIAVDR